ncbi:Nicotinamide N-methyltransferase-like [Macleaya cordata]|uniref:Nicotinamide N-methyltransferase-like n=1 Tax=Macleaya cordata TaxID=56857 RepID=A0A200R7Q6_MACCD|nr:Nicotinamide N-methyltransferase-like [Macleaya cordata]
MVSPTHEKEDDDDEDVDLNPLNILQDDDDDDDDQKEEEVTEAAAAAEEEGRNPSGGYKQQQQQHYLQSIDSSVVIRQLPSQGLSFQLWPAATTLMNLLDHHHYHQSNNNNDNITKPLSQIFDHLPCRPLRILELGSGTGLAGIAAAAIIGSSCSVTLTDLPHVLQNLHFNTAANSSMLALRGASVNVAALRWGEMDDMESIGRDFDIILGSDVVYYDHLYDPLLQTIRFFVGGGGEDNSQGAVFLMAHLRRWKKDSVFFRKARKLFNVQMIHSDPPAPGSRIGVVVYCFSRKGLMSESETSNP